MCLYLLFFATWNSPINISVCFSFYYGSFHTCKVMDEEQIKLNEDFIDCLNDEPKAMAYFQTLNKGHQNYFSKWIDSAKTELTKAKRIAMAVNALEKHWGFPEMLRANKKEKEDLGLR